MLESGLPQGRLEGERGRTCGQLRAFAALLREGSWVDAKIETAIPDRTPIPKPDLRKINTAIGPVVVFTASNFPLAFSTAGGDTASALASGCTVIVKAHESHLGTNSLVAGAIVSAAKKTNMPEGVFSSLNSKDYSVGTALVMHPSIKAVGFTGSIKGGKALYDLAQTRKEPIPVYAEMGSVNPVLLMPSKLKDNAKDLAATYSNSITMGVGQFCTNPGIIIGVQSDSLNEFAKELASNMAKVKGSCMLNKGISDNFDSNSTKILSSSTVELLHKSSEVSYDNKGSILAKINASDFLANKDMSDEVFGPFSMIVSCKNIEEMQKVVASLEGQLTVTIMANKYDYTENSSLIYSAQKIAGRVIYNGTPTGVEVCRAMHHGGTFPSSTNGKYTSVGQDAIYRFVRPVAFQNSPEQFLPEELKNGNPLKIMRIVNGKYSNSSI